jgi:hypothetical protein
MIHGFQIAFLLPLRALPFKWSRQLYDEGICYTKGAFGCLLSSSLVTSLHNKFIDNCECSAHVPMVCPHKVMHNIPTGGQWAV